MSVHLNINEYIDKIIVFLCTCNYFKLLTYDDMLIREFVIADTNYCLCYAYGVQEKLFTAIHYTFHPLSFGAEKHN